ncbi:type VI secretion system protein TssA [Yersinia bercovieri]|uniref:type VI secretion system protein TssA n=1 Tax=Yersinia bercovieri TaxID=634 RepID=UPI0005E2814D|nr:type VI secretion system protein TssA [Yersinia bercovieri]CFQ39223.1 ImpA domain-containing protein [Yersinia bercovieri]
MTSELINKLLSPINTANPCGENLEYDADFLALEQAFIGKAEQQFGDTIIPAQTPDWMLVEGLACSLLTRTKDLRIMLYLTRAWTQLRGLEGYADGLELIYQTLENYWSSLFPSLEFGGEIDPLLRTNVLAELGDKSILATCVYNSTLLKETGSEISLLSASDLLNGNNQDNPNFPGGRTRLQSELMRQQQSVTQLITDIPRYLIAIHKQVTQHLGEAAQPEFNNLLKKFNTIAQACHPPPTSQQPPMATQQLSILTPQATPAAFDWHGLQVQSRDDAQLLLEKVKNYFYLYEPSHPAPLMIDRAQKLIALDFIQIIQNLIPNGLSQLETILGQTYGEDHH